MKRDYGQQLERVSEQAKNLYIVLRHNAGSSLAYQFHPESLWLNDGAAPTSDEFCELWDEVGGQLAQLTMTGFIESLTVEDGVCSITFGEESAS